MLDMQGRAMQISGLVFHKESLDLDPILDFGHKNS